MTDGQTERVYQILEDMLKAISIEWQGSWDEYLDLVEFRAIIATKRLYKWLLLKHSISLNVIVVCVGVISKKLYLGSNMLVQITEKAKLIRGKINAVLD